MWTHYQILIVLMIIGVAGLLGGWGGYLTDPASSDQQAEPELKNLIRKRYLILGIIAAGCVPLFLRVLQSELISNIFGPKTDNAVPFQEFLVFTGFCLIAAFTARAFLDTINRQILRDVNLANTRSTNAAATAKEAHEIATDLAQEIAGTQVNEAPVERTDLLPPGIPTPEVSADDCKVLSAAAKKAFRTATGISEDTGIPRTRIGELLDLLESRGLLERTVGSTGGQRWRITPLGYHTLTARESAG